MAVERILSSDSGKVAFEKTDRNVVLLDNQFNNTVEGSLAYTVKSLTDLGYATSITVNNFNITKNGKYLVDKASTISDSPLPAVTSSKWALDVTSITTGFVQRATLVWSDLSGYNDRGKTFIRHFVDGAWAAWWPIASTTKAAFTLAALPGFTISTQDCYIMNGEFVISATIIKSSGVFGTGQQVATAPLSLPVAYVGSAMGLATGWTEHVNAWLDSNGINIATNSTKATQVFVTIKGRIL